MNSHRGCVTICIREVELEVEYEYSYEAGVHTLSNGDPGYPESSNLDGKDYTPILDRYNHMYPKSDIFGEIEDEVSENMEEGYDDEPDFDYDDYSDRHERY